MKLLAENDFDPETDIRVGENGLLEWCSNKPRLRKVIEATSPAVAKTIER